MTDKTPVDELVDDITQELEWTEEEARNFLSAFVGNTPDHLMRNVKAGIKYASEAQRKSALIDVMKKMGRHMQAEFRKGELFIKLDPKDNK